jgi:hypothetical protein
VLSRKNSAICLASVLSGMSDGLDERSRIHGHLQTPSLIGLAGISPPGDGVTLARRQAPGLSPANRRNSLLKCA